MTFPAAVDPRPGAGHPPDGPGRVNGVRNGSRADWERFAVPIIPAPPTTGVIPLTRDHRPAEAKSAEPEGQEKPKGVGGFYLAALIGTAISADTSWRFFEKIVRITSIPERILMFAVIEVTLVACGWAMRAGVRGKSGKPGPARLLAWGLCAASGYVAIVLSGPVVGLARCLLGPVLALVCLHLALGIEVKVRRTRSAGTLARVGRELRERWLSRLGLGDDARTAAQRSRDRARDRAAHLVTAAGLWGWVPRRQHRLNRAVRACGATLDAAQRGKLVEQVAVLRGIDELATITGESPWTAAVPPHVQRFVDDAQRSVAAQRAAADRDAAAILDAAQQAAAALREAAETQHRDALRRCGEAGESAAAKQAEAQREAAEMRSAAEAFRVQRETAAQQQFAQVVAAAQDEADRIRAAATAEAQALRGAAGRSTPPAAKQPPTQRTDAGSNASTAALAAALAKHFKAEVPSLRAAAQVLRDRFGSCSDRRVAEAVAALRAQRGEAPNDSSNGDSQ